MSRRVVKQSLRTLSIGSLFLWTSKQTPDNQLSFHSTSDNCHLASVSKPFIKALLNDFRNVLNHSSSKTLLDAARLPNIQYSHFANGKTAFEYDFVIVGVGNAGMSALLHLQKECPSAKIAVVDPIQKPTKRQNVDIFSDKAARLDPAKHLVYLDANTALFYKHAVLLATGVRGAPPPTYLVDERAKERLLEVRPTSWTTGTSSHSVNDIRITIMERARQGESIGILGSGWEALDMAVLASLSSRKPSQTHIFYGSSIPLGRAAPSYLGSLITKRLKSKGIHIHDQTMVRYLSCPHHADDSQNDGVPFDIYTANSNDFMDTKKTTLHWLVVAPEVSGPSGCASLATNEVPPHLVDSSEGRPWYQTWANLSRMTSSDPSWIVCFKDDGRILVNSELSACTGVFAAGSVAKCANSLSGNADVAGRGVVDAIDAGRIAAWNMARTMDGAGLFKSERRATLTRESIGVWRSDVRALQYNLGSTTLETTSLSKIGISALCVGDCDAERYGTHAIWWTNRAAQKRLLRLVEHEDTTGSEDQSLKRKRTQKVATSQTLPIYGFGVVYYLDRVGKIQGIMTWGLPFSNKEDGSLNQSLVYFLKSIILTNGGITSLDTERDHIRMSEYLSTASKRVVATAFKESQESLNDHYQLVGSQVELFPRPLHRFTEARPPSARSFSVLKRRDGLSHGILGQDLFDAFAEPLVDDPIPIPDPSQNVGFAAREAQSMYEWDVYQQKERRWDENESRARPPKEEQLWIRKGDELRNMTARDSLYSAYGSAMGR
ncbi:hypothetical protein FisN_11Lh272 [Fistulifera solaris]|uniref:Uncharacterized protein n=1 Tax=Fistulifera solaris TaxID=1519565 RepID=A0A1Z5J710_FISSO|nr:hypothetical protein FisN_11Lh272 [Fistulifera solaris]|eukprot:GAX09760.1 hypothetical protein FisN_11Lh272 [Fistulifera solaris]